MKRTAKRSQWGLTDIERRLADEQRRLRNVLTALVALALVGGICNYITQ